jgi:sugar/nucleoside kinase (ribokinase family)
VGLAVQDVLILWPDMSAPVKETRAVDVQLQGGGMTATALVAAARLGAAAELWGAVGDDWAGQMILRDLAAEKVDVSHVRVVAGESGPLVLVCVDAPSGERYFPYGRGLRIDAAPAGLSEAVAGAGCLLVDGFCPKAALAAAGAARRAGVPVVADVGGLSDAMRDLLGLVDYAIVNEATGTALHADCRRACEAVRDMGPSCAAITLGDRGCVCLSDEGYLRLPAFGVDVVDTTGTGDVFHGAFGFGLTIGLGLRENLLLASAASALKCRKLGGRAGAPTLDEARAFLADRGLELTGLQDR